MMKSQTRKHKVFYLIMGLIPIFFIPFAVEALLAFARYPIVPLVRAANPPHYNILRDNIEFQHELVTNSLGLRYPEIPLAKEANEKRVLLLGDSYVEGLGVSYGETYGAQLEKIFSNGRTLMRFINGGLTGAGPLEYAKLLYFVGLKYQPDLILLILHTNDLSDTEVIASDLFKDQRKWLEGNSDTLKRIYHSLFPRTFTFIKAIKNRGERKRTIDLIQLTRKEAVKRKIPQQRIDQWISKIPKDMIEAANRKAFNANLLTRPLLQPEIWVNNIDLEGDHVKEKWETVILILDGTVALAREKGITVRIIYAPSPLQYDEDYGEFQRNLGAVTKTEWAKKETRVESEFRKWAESQQLPFLNLTPYLRQLPDSEKKEMYYRFDGHWTPKGNKFVAKVISEWLRENKLL